MYPNTIEGWAALVTIILVGVFAFVGIFDKTRKQREEEADKIDDRLIGLLKGQIEALEKRVSILDTELESTKKTILSLQSENKILRDVLQGRDSNLQQFIVDGKKNFLQLSEVLKITKESGKNIERLYKVIEKHLENLEKNG